MRFRFTHFTIALVLLIVEVFIAFSVHDTFFRPHFGDLLVVMLIHFSIRACMDLSPAGVALGTFLFAVAVEVSQVFDLVHRLGLGNNFIAQLVLGQQFQWLDLVMYAIGAVAAFALDTRISRHSPTGR